MSDLIKRLRGKYSCGPEGIKEDRDFGTYTPVICNEAADRIEHLEAENARLVAAIREHRGELLKIYLDINSFPVDEIGKKLHAAIEGLEQ